ncbi:uncharacterized protein [Procambarus clarkii]|uniref:uncharacterized protein n=1 Tax=Procambarus clarkii TaxID=6728 RepID=UPI003743B785
MVQASCLRACHDYILKRNIGRGKVFGNKWMSKRKPSWTLLYLWATVLTVLQIKPVRFNQWLRWDGTKDIHNYLPVAGGPLSPVQPSPAPACQGRCLRHVMRQPPVWHDKRVLEHLRTRIEEAPRTPGHFPNPHHPPWANLPSHSIIETYIRNVLQTKEGGVFVEVGAQDGLWLSNSWWLEAARGWRGLLVEADPHNYLHLRASPRTSRTLPVCVTTGLRVKQDKLIRTRFPSNTTEEVYCNQKGHSKLFKYATKSDVGFGETWTSTCFPLFSVLVAAGYRQVDLLIFDMYGGGFEMTSEFLSLNAAIGKKFYAKVILYQDNELQQFFNMEDLQASFQQQGYKLIQMTQFHYLAVSLDAFIIQ